MEDFNMRVLILTASIGIAGGLTYCSPARSQPGDPYFDAGYAYGRMLNQQWRTESVWGVRPRPAPDAAIIHIEQEDTPERAARISKWEAYCQPVLSAPNANGVRRYIYARPGCEHGRSAD